MEQQNNLHHKINENVEYQVNVKRLEALERKQRPKTKVQRLRGFFIVLTVLGVICQFVSALLASAGVLHHVNTKLNAAGFIGACIAVCLLLALEGAKRFTFGSFHNQRLDDGQVQRITYIGILLFGGVSVASTFFYSPYAIEYLAAPAKLVSIDSIKDVHNEMILQDTSYWHNQKYAQLSKASAYFEANKKRDCKTCPWRLSSSKWIVMPYANLVEPVKGLQDSLNKYYVIANNLKSKTIKSANKENSQIVKQHKAWCSSFGFNMGLTSILIEILFFMAYWWCADYNRLEVTEGRSILKMRLQEQQLPTVGGQPLREEVEVEEDKGEDEGSKVEGGENVLVNEEVKNMQFQMSSNKSEGSNRVEGYCIKGEGRKHTTIIGKVDGELRELKEGDLNRYLRECEKAESSTKKPYYEKLKKQLQDYKIKHKTK